MYLNACFKMHVIIVPPLFAFFFHTFFVFVYTRNHAGVFTVFTCIYVSVFWSGVSGSSCTCSLFSLLSQSILCTAGRRGVNNPLFQHRPQKNVAQIQNSTQSQIPDTDENTDTLLFSNVLTLAYAVPNTGHQPCLKSCFQENLISIWVPLFSVKIPASLNQQFFRHRLLYVTRYQRPRWETSERLRPPLRWWPPHLPTLWSPVSHRVSKMVNQCPAVAMLCSALASSSSNSVK